MELTGEVEARLLTIDHIRNVADRRHRLHTGHATHRPLSEDYEFIGLMGQWEFGRQFNMAIDLTDRPGGDGRINFITDIGTLSVSTAQKPNNLLREVGKECARYHVLAKFSAKNQDSYWYRHSSVRLIGWESDEVMLQQPTRDFGHGIVSHYLLARELRPIIELRYLLLGEGIQARLI